MLFYDYLTDFIFTENVPENADIIFVPGGGYGEIAENAAKLYHKGYAPLILVSGKYSITDGYFSGVKSPARSSRSHFTGKAGFLYL